MDRINITGERSIDRADAERAGMDRVNAIWNHPVYQKYYRRLEKLEEKRIFCRHQMTHLLDVARIARIRSFEIGLGLDPEVIYAAAVLHDIGKSLQYEEKIPHEAAGVKIAGEILESLPEGKRFTEQEKKMILTAIEGTGGSGKIRSRWRGFCMRATRRQGCALPAGGRTV